VLSLTVLGRSSGQDLASRATEEPCDLVEVGIRLRIAHPLGAARSEAGQCPVVAARWVETEPLRDRQRTAWRRAVASLRASPDASCRLAARTLVWLERAGAVSVWTPPDTAQGMIFFGATYFTSQAAPIALQLWSRALERPVDWLAGALAHEAYHVLDAHASEAEATAFGETCARRLGSPDHAVDELAASEASSGR